MYASWEAESLKCRISGCVAARRSGNVAFIKETECPTKYQQMSCSQWRKWNNRG